MTDWRLSPTLKTSRKRGHELLHTQEFNFSKKFIWKLPGITPKFHSISPVIVPVRATKAQKIKKFFSLTPGEVRERMQSFPDQDSNRHKMPQLLVKGTQKLCNKPYFRKTFLARMLCKNTPQKVRKMSVVDDQVIDPWNDFEE
jgi:hypothetical protein